MQILDSQARQVASLDHLVDQNDLYELEPGKQVLIFGRDFPLEAGRYTLLLGIDQNDGRMTGHQRTPISVERFEAGRLQLSDIESASPGTLREPGPVLTAPPRPYLPDPTGTVDSDGKLDIAYTVYNLGRDEKGSAWYEVEYLIVPLKYRRAYARLLSASGATIEDSLRFGSQGDSLGAITLTEENRRLTRFLPVEVKRIADDLTVRKLGRVDLSKLPEGFYALRVTVTDVVTGESAWAEIPVRKISDLERDSMLKAAS
jgi:hypothetical protein